MNIFLKQHLADLPEVVDAITLAKKAGWQVQTVYQRAWRQKKKRNSTTVNLLPERLVLPGGNELTFTRAAVVDWFNSSADQPNKIKTGRGRPKGATSRRGIGRVEFEGSAA